MPEFAKTMGIVAPQVMLSLCLDPSGCVQTATSEPQHPGKKQWGASIND